jgi:hypothetical protein
MKALHKRRIYAFILWALTGVALICVVVFFLKGNTDAANLFVSFLGIFAMLSIAFQTFLIMEQSTNDTIKSITDSSDKQIGKFAGFINQIEKTNAILGSVSSSLKIVSDDVVTKQGLVPRLNVTFRDNLKQISIRAGSQNEILFCVHNSGRSNANNLSWSVFLPEEMKILDKGDFIASIKQPANTRRPHTNRLTAKQYFMEARNQIPHKVKIETDKTFVGLVKIPFSCSCDNTPQNEDELLIDFVG